MFASRFLAPAAIMLAISAGPALAAGDPAHGVVVFRTSCGVCHLALKGASISDSATKIGPNLWGVDGRPAGSLRGFHYSSAMRGSGVVWSYEKLRVYAHAPQKTIPNVRMAFPGLPNQKDADDVAAYLVTLK